MVEVYIHQCEALAAEKKLFQDILVSSSASALRKKIDVLL